MVLSRPDGDMKATYNTSSIYFSKIYFDSLRILIREWLVPGANLGRKTQTPQDNMADFNF